MFALGARAPAQNSAVFNLVPNLGTQSEDMSIFNSVNRTHAHYCQIVGKVLGNQRKTGTHKDPVPRLVPEYKVLLLASARILAWVLGF